jgi:hypothetical protein
MLGLAANAEICRARSDMVHETVRRTCASIRTPAAAVTVAPYTPSASTAAATMPVVVLTARKLLPVLRERNCALRSAGVPYPGPRRRGLLRLRDELAQR